MNKRLANSGEQNIPFQYIHLYAFRKHFEQQQQQQIQQILVSTIDLQLKYFIKNHRKREYKWREKKNNKRLKFTYRISHIL